MKLNSKFQKFPGSKEMMNKPSEKEILSINVAESIVSNCD